MKEYWNNLRPLEKRLVVAVGSVLFILLNFWFVVPHFSDWSKIDRRIDTASRKRNLFQAEIARMPVYEAAINSIEGSALAVPQEDQMLHFSTSIQSEAARSIGIPSSTGKIRTETNQFFLELSQNITVQSKEQPLVDFLYNLGSSNSMIRVRDLALHPDPPHHQLMASIKLVANYQRKQPAKTTISSAPRSTTTTPAKPASAPATAPANSTPPKKAAEPAKTPVQTPPARSGTNPASPPIKKFLTPPNRKAS